VFLRRHHPAASSSPSPSLLSNLTDHLFRTLTISVLVCRTMLQTIQQQSLRQSSLDSTSTRTSFDSSRYTSSQNNTRHSSHGHSRSQGSRTPQRAYSHPVPPQPPVRPNVLTRLNTSGAALGSHSRSQPPSPAQLSPYVHINHNGQPFVRVNQPNTGHAGFDPYAGGRYVTYGH
jgi:hypothetical protein